MAKPAMQASSADRGFFQEVPLLRNQAHEDVAFQRVIKLLVPSATARLAAPDLHALGRDVLSRDVFAWVVDAERNEPYVSGDGADAFGQPAAHYHHHHHQVPSSPSASSGSAGPGSHPSSSSEPPRLVVGHGWRALQRFGVERGIVAAGYEPGAVARFGAAARTVQFLRLHLWTGSCANVTCPSAMQDGAARLLQLRLARGGEGEGEEEEARAVFADAFDRLTSRDPERAWTSGQWMTERSGGSDVSGTETVATYSPIEPSEPPARGTGLPTLDATSPGPWRIDGFKWFSSATDADMAVLLAQIPPSEAGGGGGGLSVFLAPTRLPLSSSLGAGPISADAMDATFPRPPTHASNGIRIARLKRKLGTRSLPTAELELRGARAWLIGAPGKGLATIAPVLTVTRVYSAVSAVGYLGRGLAVARAWARARSVAAPPRPSGADDVGAEGVAKMGGAKQRPPRPGKVPLQHNPLHMRTLARMHADYRAMMLLVFWTCGVMGAAEGKGEGSASSAPAAAAAALDHALPLLPETPAGATAASLMRLLTPLLKAYVCAGAVPLMHACVEALGGVGYLENSETEHLNVARLFRDLCVLPIWEGTTDVLSVDLVRAATSPKAGEEGARCVVALDAWLDRLLVAALPSSSSSDRNGAGLTWGVEARSLVRSRLRAEWAAIRSRLETTPRAELVRDARALLFRLAETLAAALLVADAASDGANRAARVVAGRWLVDKGFVGKGDEAAMVGVGESGDAQIGLEIDRAIVFGEGEGVEGKSRL